MTLEEFKKLLDPKNIYAENLADKVQWFERNRTIVLIRKSRALLEDIQSLLEAGIYPLVDTKLGVLFGLEQGTHLMVRVMLFRYHNASGKTSEMIQEVEAYEAADKWLYQGMGYYFSSMMLRRNLKVGPNYAEDRFDKDVFLTFKKDHHV